MAHLIAQFAFFFFHSGRSHVYSIELLSTQWYCRPKLQIFGNTQYRNHDQLDNRLIYSGYFNNAGSPDLWEYCMQGTASNTWCGKWCRQIHLRTLQHFCRWYFPSFAANSSMVLSLIGLARSTYVYTLTNNNWDWLYLAGQLFKVCSRSSSRSGCFGLNSQPLCFCLSQLLTFSFGRGLRSHHHSPWKDYWLKTVIKLKPMIISCSIWKSWPMKSIKRNSHRSTM